MRQISLFNRIPARKFAPALVIVFNSIVWYTLTIDLFSNYVNQDVRILAVHFASVALAAIVGVSVFRRSRENCLSLWALFGAGLTALLPLLGNSISVNMFESLLFGVSVGIGLPSCLAYLGDVTKVENRGTYGGVTWGAVGFSVFALALIISSFNIVQAFELLALWRFAGFIAFFILSKIQGRIPLSSIVPSYRSILHRRDMLLYLLPWAMFSLVNFAEAPLIKISLGANAATAGIIELLVSGFFAIIGGILADSIGRKRVVITGFIILGIEYAVFGLFPRTPAIWGFYTFSDGVAWGLFASVFFMTIWGDLAGNDQKEKYYLLGGLSYLLAEFLPSVVTPYLAVIDPATAFSLASFFLFVAVLPLMYATETLYEKRIREIELKTYLEKAKKVKEKYA